MELLFKKLQGNIIIFTILLPSVIQMETLIFEALFAKKKNHKNKQFLMLNVVNSFNCYKVNSGFYIQSTSAFHIQFYDLHCKNRILKHLKRAE